MQLSKSKIINILQIPCPVATFHSAGSAVIRRETAGRRRIVDNGYLSDVVRRYFQGPVLKDENMTACLIRFLAFYFDTPYEGSDFYDHLSRFRFTTLKSELGGFGRKIVGARTNREVTILAEIVRTEEEAAVANFLHLNGIGYEYQALYTYDVKQAGRPYTPDFRIRQAGKECFIEHFGISEDGQSGPNSGEGCSGRHSEEELQKFRKAVREKALLHRAYGTKCIFLFSSYADGRPLTAHLAEELEAAGFRLRPRPECEVLRELILRKENRYFRRLIPLVCRFIVNFKTNGLTDADFCRLRQNAKDERTRLFLTICRACFREYVQVLHDSGAVDFQDMINESARILLEAKEMKHRPDYKYIIVDEYQDISRQRFNLVSALRDVTDAKIVAVGDDWQSVFAFSGSDISLFTKFAEHAGPAALLKIVRTYRNSQEVIDIAGRFIQKNKTQIRKDLVSHKHIRDPVIIFTYDSHYGTGNAGAGSGAVYAPARAVESALEHIIENDRGKNRKNGAAQKILLIGRFGFDGDFLERSGLFEREKGSGGLRSLKYPDLDLTFLTAHSSKGLGFDNVIVINGRNGTYGFPAKIGNDPVISLVVKDDPSIEYAEERRLFYVAMTRTKNRVYFIAPKEDPSEFLLELKRDFRKVVLKGRWNSCQRQRPSFRKTCPVCGYPLKLQYKVSYCLRLWQCTNEPELCGFMTDDPASAPRSDRSGKRREAPRAPESFFS